MQYAGTANPPVVPSALRYDTHVGRGEMVLALRGEADAATGPLVRRALAHATSSGHARVAVDLADLSFIDTHCLGIIFATHRRLEARGVDLVLRAPQPAVRRLLDILQRHDLLESA